MCLLINDIESLCKFRETCRLSGPEDVCDVAKGASKVPVRERFIDTRKFRLEETQVEGEVVCDENRTSTLCGDIKTLIEISLREQSAHI